MIAGVIRWVNGMVMVFDEEGQQLPGYQGRWKDMREKILHDKPSHVTIEGPREWFPGQASQLMQERK